MGTWDSGPFDNDAASDWVWTLEEATDTSVLEEALLPAVAPDEYLEAPTATCALAAAEVVAALAGQPRPELPEEVTAWVSRQSTPLDPALVALARRAVERTVAASELLDLWMDASPEDLAAWRGSVDDLLARLAK